MNQTDKSIKL